MNMAILIHVAAVLERLGLLDVKTQPNKKPGLLPGIELNKTISAR
jgi:hypothetical protein